MYRKHGFSKPEPAGQKRRFRLLPVMAKTGRFGFGSGAIMYVPSDIQRLMATTGWCSIWLREDDSLSGRSRVMTSAMHSSTGTFEHAADFASVCLLLTWWSFKLSRHLNVILHTLHPWGFSLEWTTACLYKMPADWKLFLHKSHLNDLSAIIFLGRVTYFVASAITRLARCLATVFTWMWLLLHSREIFLQWTPLPWVRLAMMIQVLWLIQLFPTVMTRELLCRLMMSWTVFISQHQRYTAHQSVKANRNSLGLNVEN